MNRLFLPAVSFAVLFALTGPSFAQPRPGLVLDPETYGNRWAVIVGINYDNQAGSAGAVKLDFAEDDAKAVRDLLVANYGYAPEKTILLLGEQAKKADIDRALTTLWSEKVAKDDSVLFYFSGHGYGRRGANSTRGQLMPADVRYEGGQPSFDSVLELDRIVDHFNQDCAARHKLLVLDCCYSAAVFSEYTQGRPAKVLEAGSVEETFSQPAFQAMVASKANAQDSGIGGHSPFTGALLESLKYMPRRRPQGAGIRTTELFAQMKLYFADYLGRGQSPSCSWLSNDQGEFHFFPDPNSKFPDPEIPDQEIRKMMVAMVPGSFGNWWFSETPWFMPGLRYSILEKDGENRSAELELITPDRLREAADKLQAKMTDNQDERFQARMGHLKKLLSTQGEGLKAVVSEIVADLKREAEKPDADPLDVHYLAVLQHGAGLGEQAEAKASYDLAIRLYEKRLETEGSAKPMLALCYSDRGWYRHDVQFDYEEARNDFMKARSIYGQETPAPFLIYVLCREADSFSRLGHTGAVERRLKDIEELVKNCDPAEMHPISAAYYHRRGWINMDWCDFKSAAENFARSNTILEKETVGFGIDGTIMQLHNLHGEAMAIRFSGDAETAMYKYRALLQRITAEFGKLRDDAEANLNFRQVRARIAERWVNTLERSGDCSLFGQPTDAGEAADDYRRAIRAATYLPLEQRKRWEQRLRYKYAMALALPDTGVQDLELAEEQFRIIQAINQTSVAAAVHRTSTVMPSTARKGEDGVAPSATSTESDPGSESTSQLAVLAAAKAAAPPLLLGPGDANQDLGIVICRSLTRLLILHCRAQADCEDGQSCEQRISLSQDTDIFRLQLQKLLEDNRLNPSLRRDELEAAMYCMQVLLKALPNPALDPDPKLARQGRITRQNDVDLLLGYCRLARPKNRKTPGAAMQTVAFLRPYYDCAMQSLIELKPSHSKQLVEIAHEARLGRSHFKSDRTEATLVLYCMPERSYFFLDVPRSTSTYYELPAGLDLEMLQASTHGELARRHKLPPELGKELLLISNYTLDATNGSIATAAMPVRICWDDPLRGMRAHNPRPTSPLATNSQATSAGKLVTQEMFPFELPATLTLLTEDTSFAYPAQDVVPATQETPVATTTTID